MKYFILSRTELLDVLRSKVRHTQAFGHLVKSTGTVAGSAYGYDDHTRTMIVAHDGPEGGLELFGGHSIDLIQLQRCKDAEETGMSHEISARES